MNKLTSHIKNHHLKYIAILMFVVLIAGYLYINKSSASGNYSFIKKIGNSFVPSSGNSLGFFFFPRKVAVDSQGNLFVGGIFDIQKFDSSGNFVKVFGGTGDGDDKFFFLASNISIDSQDNIYVADIFANHIKKFDNNGNFLMKFGTPGAGDGEFNSPVAVAVDKNDIIYVVDSANARMQIFTNQGVYLSQFTFTPDALTPNYTISVAFDSQNNIYTTNTETNIVSVYSSSTKELLSQFDVGIHTGDIDIDSQDNIYVSEYYGNHIKKYDSAKTFVTQYDESNALTGGLCSFSCPIYIDNSDNIYLSAIGEVDSILVKFDNTFSYIKKWHSRASAPYSDGDFVHASGVAVDSEGNIYVSDSVTNRVQKFDNNGNFLMKFGTPGVGDGEFNVANGIALDSFGNILVIDYNNNRIQKFDSDGNYISQFGGHGTGDGQFEYSPESMVVDTDGNVWVSSGCCLIQKFSSSTNSFVLKFGDYGSGDSQFYSTPKLAYYNNLLFALDVGNAAIKKFDNNGSYVSSIPYSANLGDTEFGSISNINIDNNGNIFVTNVRLSNLTKIDQSGNVLATVGKFGYEVGDLFSPTSVSFLEDGKLLISDLKGLSVWGIPPFIISSLMSSVTTNSAVFTWNTSEPATAGLEYSIAGNPSTSTIDITSPLNTSHSIDISNLPTCTTVQYRVKSTNSELVTTMSNSSTVTTSGCTAMAEVISSNSEVASTTATSTLTLETIKLDIPSDFSSSSATTTFQAKKLESVTFYEEVSLPVGKVSVGTSVFNLVAIDLDTLQKISSSSAPILISFTYSPSDLSGIDPATLSIYRYDGSTWYPLSNCSTNTNTNTVSCFTSNFSDFALFATPVATTNTTSGGGIILPINAQTESLNNTPVTIASNPIQQAINSLNTVSIKFSRTLKRGMSGADVSTLQQYLSSIPGIYPEALITGYFGNLTYKAVQRYQCQYNIVCQGTEVGTGWGVVGPRTRGVLK